MCLRWTFWTSLMACLLVSLNGSAQETQKPFRIIGYLPEYRFSKLDLDHASQLTDLILFTSEPAASGEVELGRLKNAPWEDLWELRERHGTRLILCVMGTHKSEQFSKAVSTAESRDRLVHSVLTLLKDRRLDGVDIDWEYPETAQDWKGFVQLLSQLRIAFEADRYSLSLTVAPWREIPERAWRLADTVQLMSYDYGQKHSTLEQAQQDVQKFLKQGIPAHKLVLGVPFYGRNVTDRKAVIYSKIMENDKLEPGTDEIDGVYFNGRQTVTAKTQAAIDAGIAGVMVWEIGQDTTDETSLLRTISNTVSAHARRQPSK